MCWYFPESRTGCESVTDGAAERAGWEEHHRRHLHRHHRQHCDVTITVTITIAITIAITFAIKKPINMNHQKQLTSAGTVGPNCIHWAGLN